MFSFLFSKKKSSKEQNPSSANDSNSLANPSFANLISQINNLKEENERKKMHIETLEKQLNQQQIQILNLKKAMKDLKKQFQNAINLENNCKDNSKIHNKISRTWNRSTAKSFCSEFDDFAEDTQQEDCILGSMSFFENFNENSHVFTSRASFSLKELHIKPNELERQNLNKFLQCIKISNSAVFKEIKKFIYNHEEMPFCSEIYDFIDKIHQKLEQTPKFIETWGLFNEDLLEDLIFEGIYSKVFNVDEDINAKSIQIHEKLLVLQNIVTPDLLDIPLKCRIPSVLIQLQNDLKKINERKSPKKKLQVIAHCFQNLVKLHNFDCENEEEQKPPNADDLFPLLVLIVLNANPENFHSNIEFILNYIRQSCLIGEEGYMLITIKAAVAFLENLDGLGLRNGNLLSKRKNNEP